MDQSNESGLFVPPLAAVSHDTTQIKDSGLMMKLPAKCNPLGFWFWKILSQFTLSLPSKGWTLVFYFNMACLLIEHTPHVQIIRWKIRGLMCCKQENYSRVVEKKNLWHSLSPIIPARTITILKVMKAMGIPNNDCSPNYSRNKFGSSVAVTTNAQILENAK